MNFRFRPCNVAEELQRMMSVAGMYPRLCMLIPNRNIPDIRVSAELGTQLRGHADIGRS